MTMNLTGGMFPTSVHMLRCAIRQFSAESVNADLQISLKTVHGEFIVMSFCGREGKHCSYQKPNLAIYTPVRSLQMKLCPLETFSGHM